jgi:hypothetical protein
MTQTIVFNEIFIREVNDVRSVYPNLFSNSTAGSTNGLDQLKDQIRIEKVMLAYEISFTITMFNSATYQSMSNFLNTATSDKGDGLSIWGFQFRANSDSSYSRDVSNITMSSTANGGTIKLAATPPGLTFMMGAIGKSCNLAYELCELLGVSVGDFGLVVDWKDCRSFNLMLLSRRLALFYFCFVPKSDTGNPLSKTFWQIQINNRLPTICPRSLLRYEGASRVENQQYCQQAYCI